MLLPQVPRSIFILSLKSRWQRRVGGAVAGDHLIEKTPGEGPIRSSPAKEGFGVRVQALAKIAKQANTRHGRGCR
jgi:hypothetical protein